MADPQAPWERYGGGTDAAQGAGPKMGYGELGSDIADRYHEAHTQLKSDLDDLTGAPIDPRKDPAGAVRQAAKRSTPMFGGGSLGMDYANEALSPIQGGLDFALGRPIEAATGGRVSRKTVGDAAFMLAPLGDIVLGERAANAAARAMGVTRATYEAHEAAAAAGREAEGARQAAARRLIGPGGLKSPEARESAAEHRRVGAGEPTLLDTMKGTAQRVVRAAGGKMGEGDERLEEHRRNVRAGLSGRMTRRTEQMAPYRASIEQKKASLEVQRDSLAQDQYRGPYAEPVESDERLFDVLDDQSGFSAMREARATARTRALDNPEAARQFHEIGSLLDWYGRDEAYKKAHAEWVENGGGNYETRPSKANREMLANPRTAESVKATLKKELGFKPTPEPQPPKMPTISAGSIDRIRIAMRERAKLLDSHGKAGRAGGIKHREAELDNYLDGLPHLQEARATYHDLSRQIEQLDFDTNLSTMDPEDFKGVIGKLNPEQRKALTQSIVKRLAAKMAASPRGSQAQEDIYTEGYWGRENLRTLLGKDLADDYLRAIDLEREKLTKATYASSRQGSQTQPRTADEEALKTSVKVGFSLLSGHWNGAVHSVMDLLLGRMQGMTPAEARVIAEWAVRQDKVEDTLHEIADAAEGKQRQGGQRVAMPGQVRALIMGAVVRRQSGPEPKDDDADTSGDDAPWTNYAPTSDGGAAQPASGAPGGPKVPAPQSGGAGGAKVAGSAPDGGNLQNIDFTGEDIPKMLNLVRRLEASGDQAVSPAGAIGRYQIWPPTAERYGFDVSRLSDPAYSKHAAEIILRDLNERYHGDVGAILVAYNGGEGRADEWLRSGRNPAVLKPETRKYLARAGLLGDEGDLGDDLGPEMGDDDDLGDFAPPAQPSGGDVDLSALTLGDPQ